ncbi:MAG: mannitol dehydrogenase family protein [Lachnospiraceae bacterium]|nr:mannitol dehydrogenase family protein [Lachnospiraceae bacterium]
MFLTNKGISDKAAYESKGYILPAFDRALVKKETDENPEWIHFGAGNIFRAFQGNLCDRMLEMGINKTGLLVCEGYDYEIVEKMYRPHDDLNILVTLKADGTMEKKVIGSIVTSLILDRNNNDEFGKLLKVFEKPSLKMVSFTITEKGYVVKNPAGELLPGTVKDIEAGPDGTEGYIGKIASLLYHRFECGELPVAMVSMDNCSHNGDKLYDAIVTFAKGWTENGKAKDGFLEYVKNPDKVSFPWSMIDKITPRPDEKVSKSLEADGIEDLSQVVTTKNTYVAPFVNAEETEYLVIEDKFPNGKLPLDKVGVIYTERETVDKVEKMKVCTCLNPLHTSLAIYGCLLGFSSIHDEMDDEDLKNLVYTLGHKEGMKVVVNPGVLSPDEFLDAVLLKRLPNPFMPDTPQRIACDTSQKLPIRFGETIKAYRLRDDLSTDSLTLVPLVLAGWLRYFNGSNGKGIDDCGNEFELSPDPKIAEVQGLDAKEILAKTEIFGCDLFEDGLGDKVLAMYEELCKGTGAVREVLHKYVLEAMA